MNNLLLDLYNNYWDSFILNEYIPCSNTEHETAYPFLIKVTQHYIDAQKKIMICGQETQGWGGIDGRIPPAEKSSTNLIRSIYNGFVNKNENNKIKKPGYNSPYWNFIWCIMKAYPDFGFVFQNVVKVGKRHEAGCDDYIDKLSQKYFPVFGEELKILRPDLIVFLTGPNYDERIKYAMGDFEKEQIGDGSILCDRLKFKNPDFPSAIRINHPGWLQRKHKYRIMVDEVIRNIEVFVNSK